MNKFKFITACGLMAIATAAVAAVTSSGSDVFVRAGNPKTIDLVPAIVSSNKLSNVPNTTPKAFPITINHVTYEIEALLCSVNNGKVVIEENGYIKNITAFNNLSSMGASTNVTFIECEYDETNDVVSSIGMTKNVSSCPFSTGTNFVVKTNGEQTTLTSLVATYNCNNEPGLIDTSDATFTNEWAYTSEGSGTELDPYIIDNELAFVMFAKDVNNGNNYGDPYSLGYEIKHFKLSSSLDFTKDTAPEYVSVGCIDNDGNMYPFSGHFDGGYDEGLSIKLDSEFTETNKQGGVFGYIDSASVENLCVEGSIKYGPASVEVGGIVGHSYYGEIKNCVVNARLEPLDVEASSVLHMGGLVGYLEMGTIVSECVVSSYVEICAGEFCGGLIGSINDSDYLIENCLYNGTFYAYEEGTSCIGGLFGSIFDNYPTDCIVDCEIDEESAIFGVFNALYEEQEIGNVLSNYSAVIVGECFDYDDSPLFFEPGCWDVKDVTEAFYIYSWNGKGNYWTKIEYDADYEMYVFHLSDVIDADGFLFTRMNHDSIPNWSNVWNQTVNVNLEIKNNAYIIDGWGDGSTENKSVGHWELY